MTQQPFDDEINQLYQQRKAENKLPAETRSRINRAIGKNDVSASPWQQLNHWSYGAAATFSLVMLFWLVPGPQHEDVYTIALADSPGYAKTEIHQLNAEQTATLAAAAPAPQSQYAIELEQSYSAYLVANKNAKNVRAQAGTLIKVNGDWQIAVCDELLMQISEQLVVELSSEENQLLAMRAGDLINVITNSQGHIIDLQPAQGQMQCAS